MDRFTLDFKALACLVIAALGPGTLLAAACGSFILLALMLLHLLISMSIGVSVYVRRIKQADSSVKSFSSSEPTMSRKKAA